MRRDRLAPTPPEELRAVARELLAIQVERLPRENPVARFGERLTIDLPVLLTGDQDEYHVYAFATVRQCGAAWETAAAFMTWLGSPGDESLAAAAAFESLAAQCKTLLFKLARAAASQRAFDIAPAIQEMASTWDAASGHARTSSGRTIVTAAGRCHTSGHTILALDSGWEVASAPPDAVTDERLDGLDRPLVRSIEPGHGRVCPRQRPASPRKATGTPSTHGTGSFAADSRLRRRNQAPRRCYGWTGWRRSRTSG